MKAKRVKMKRESKREIAERITQSLFRNYFGEQVQRIVLVDDEPPRDWGGLCFASAVDHIQDVLESRSK